VKLLQAMEAIEEIIETCNWPGQAKSNGAIEGNCRAANWRTSDCTAHKAVKCNGVFHTPHLSTVFERSISKTQAF